MNFFNSDFLNSFRLFKQSLFLGKVYKDSFEGFMLIMATLKKSKKNLVFAILPIIIIIFAIIIYFSQSSVYPSYGEYGQCIAASGFSCSNLVLNFTTGNIVGTLGQNTGTNWNNIYFVFVQMRTLTSSETPNVSFSQPNAAYISNMATGTNATVNLIVARPGILTKNQEVTGTIWARYTVNGTNQTSYVQMVTVNIKAS